MKDFMNKASTYIVVISLIVAGTYSIYNKYFKNVRDFIDSNFFVALITVLVGLFAIYLYIQKKHDRKRDVAKLILQEIRYAEQEIRNARSRQNEFMLAFKVLPTNTWFGNIHLFADNLDLPDIDSITRFYSQAEYIDNVVNIISSYKNGLKISSLIVNEQALDLADKSPDSSEQAIAEAIRKDLKESELKNLIRAETTNIGASDILKDVTKKIEFIYDSSAIDKIKKIANFS